VPEPRSPAQRLWRFGTKVRPLPCPLDDAEAVAEAILGSAPQLDTVLAVNHVLGRLFELTLRNRIPIRNATLLAYIGSLLLYSMGGVKSEVLGAGGSEALKLMAQQALESIESESDSNSDSASS
jgi:hypothetical protein